MCVWGGGGGEVVEYVSSPRNSSIHSFSFRVVTWSTLPQPSAVSTEILPYRKTLEKRRLAFSFSFAATSTPFVVRFRSDAYEFNGAGATSEAADNTGFCIGFTMDSTGCN